MAGISIVTTKADDFSPLKSCLKSGRFWTSDRWRTFYFGQATQTMLWDEPIVSQHVSLNFSLGFGFGRTGGDALRSDKIAHNDTGHYGSLWRTSFVSTSRTPIKIIKKKGYENNRE
jgi:hypothetical protein